MKSPPSNDRVALSDPDATLDLTPSHAAPRGLLGMGPRVAIVERSGPHYSSETQTLLRVRLRAAAVLFLVGFSLFLVRTYVLLAFTRDEFGFGHFVNVFHIGVCLLLALLVALLSSRTELSMRQLRRLEVAMFGVITAFFAVFQWQSLTASIKRDDSVQLLMTMESSQRFMFLTIITYGMFIPATWKRAARMVAPMAVMPPLVALFVRLTQPRLVDVVVRVISPALISELWLLTIIGVVVALYGAHVLNTLREQVFEARKYGQYQLRRLIGRGGMGEVYLAEHRMLKRPCALKLIRPDSAGDPQMLARFEREVQTAARLTHPNTIEIYDYGQTEDGTFYYVMEYLEGLNLAELVEHQGALPPGRVIYLLRQACEALAEAHAAGLIHRDLKPANLFAAHLGGRYDFVKLLDFGLVKPTREEVSVELSREGAITGSPLYMAPEQAGGDQVPDARCDFYALGAVGYFLLTGRPPFEGKRALEVLIAHARDPVVPPSHWQAGVPRDLEAVILRCLEKDPGRRFPNAEALEHALAGCAAANSWTPNDSARWWKEQVRAGG